MKVEDNPPAPCRCQKRWDTFGKRKLIFGLVILRSSGLPGRSEATARKPPVFQANRPAFPTPAPRSPSHAFCLGTLDLASVSPSVRSISNSVRRTHPPVSANLRRKPPLIARRAVYDCAPLHVRNPDPAAVAGAPG